MQRFKVGELTVDPQTTILMEGSNSPQLFTALHGLGLRYKLLEDGSRQVINFVFPGDFLGLQAGVMGEMGHSVEASSRMTLCVFDRAELWSLFKSHPDVARRIGGAVSGRGAVDRRPEICLCVCRLGDASNSPARHVAGTGRSRCNGAALSPAGSGGCPRPVIGPYQQDAGQITQSTIDALERWCADGLKRGKSGHRGRNRDRGTAPPSADIIGPSDRVWAE